MKTTTAVRGFIKIELISPSRAARGRGARMVSCSLSARAHRRLTGLASMWCFLDGERVSVTITRNTRFVTSSIDRAINVRVGSLVEFNFISRFLYARHVDDARPENGWRRKPTRTKLWNHKNSVISNFIRLSLVVPSPRRPVVFR